MAAAPEKFCGWWMQGKVEGDVTNWLTSEGVGFLMRQAAWAAGYGAGKSKMGLLISDGVVYNEQHLDSAGRFRSKFKLGGEKEKLVVCEGAPLIPTKTAWIEGKWTDDGALEMTLWDETKSKKIREARRSVSEDGSQLTTVATMFLSDGSSAAVTTTHNRMEEPPLNPETCSSWCPVLISADSQSPGNPDLLSALSDSLEGIFPSEAALLETMEKIYKKKPLSDDEKAVSYSEVSASEFSNEITKSDGSKYTLSYQFDKEKNTWKIGFMTDGTEHLTYFLRVITGPLRVEGWCLLPNGDRHSPPSVLAIEDTIGQARKLFLEK